MNNDKRIAELKTEKQFFIDLQLSFNAATDDGEFTGSFEEYIAHSAWCEYLEKESYKQKLLSSQEKMAVDKMREVWKAATEYETYWGHDVIKNKQALLTRKKFESFEQYLTTTA